MVECQLPKLKVAGSIPVSRSSIYKQKPQRIRYWRCGFLSLRFLRFLSFHWRLATDG
jgi:hypothetical protein